MNNKSILFLFTELSGYILACFNYASENGYNVHVINYPINSHAPFLIEKLEKKSLFFYNKNKFNTYKIMEESEVLVSSMSLMLRENILLRNKILAANLTGYSVYNFPLNKFFTFNGNRYEEFEKKLFSILKMRKTEYFKKAGKNIDYCILNNSSPTRLIRSVIKQYI